MSSKLIIHPTDFSDCSYIALEFAINLAIVQQCKLLLVHSIDSSRYEGHDESGQMLLTKSKEIEEHVDQLLREMGVKVQQHGIECAAQIYAGKLNSWLPEKIQSEKPAYVVMGTTGAGSVANKVFGSNTFAILQEAECPVFAIPKSTPQTKPKNIILAADLSQINDSTIKYMDDFAATREGKLSVVSVTTAVHESKNYDLLEKAKRDYPNVNFELLTHNDYVQAINDHINEVRPDLVAIVMTNKGFFERLLFDSLSDKLIHYSNVPILAIPRR